MGFWGKSFVFDDVHCENFDLMVYDFGETDQHATTIGSASTIIEENMPGRMRPIFLGAKRDKKLELTMVFGVNIPRIDEARFLDRYEMDAVANWLTASDSYKYLAIEQDDMRFFRYRCITTSLSVVTYGNLPWALRATFTCDGPYGYMYPAEYEFSVDNTDVGSTVELYNESTIKDYLEPVIQLTNVSGFNMLNPDACTIGKYLKANGTAASSELWFASDYIPVTALTSYIISGQTTPVPSGTVACHCFYNGSKVMIGSTSAYNMTFQTPANTSYVRLSVRATDPEDVMFSKGTSASAFQAYPGGTISIVNNTDDGRTFKFSELPNIGSDTIITIDNMNRIITASNDQNLYPYFNFKFFRLKRGYNSLTLKGTGTVKFICEFPVNIGG